MEKKDDCGEHTNGLCISLDSNLGSPVGHDFSPQVASEVGSSLGVVAEVERRQRQDDLNFFMRVRVALPITKPIRRGVYIADSDGERTWVRFKYERLPLFCYYCGILGHDLKHCAQHFAMQKSGGEVEYQYGDWLKATGG